MRLRSGLAVKEDLAQLLEPPASKPIIPANLEKVLTETSNNHANHKVHAASNHNLNRMSGQGDREDRDKYSSIA